MKMVAFILCFIALVANSKSAVLSPDTEPPKFTYCPSDMVVETYKSWVRVNWNLPQAVDNSGRPPVIKNNINPGEMLGLGEHNVEYTAMDASFNTATCKFKVTVKRKYVQCPKLHLPVHGALVCNGGPDIVGRFCMATCQIGYDFAFPPSLLSLCSDQGRWMPFFGGVKVPDCSVRRGPSLSPSYYYKGDANDPATQAALKNSLLQVIKNFGLNIHICKKQKDSCNVKRFIVYPGPKK